MTTRISHLDRLIEEAGQRLPDGGELDAICDETARLLNGGRYGAAAGESITRQFDAALTRLESGRERADELLREAAARLSGLPPEPGRYEALRQVVAAFRERFPALAQFGVKPETRLFPPPGLPAPPALSAEYAHFATLSQTPPEFWLDPVYLELDERSLPDGAMMAICALPMYTEKFIEYDMGDVCRANRRLLCAYGVRLLPAAIEILSRPGPSIRTNAAGTRWFEPGGHLFYDAAWRWPAAEAKAFFRLVLESGWNSAGEFLGDEPWGKELRAEMADSPHGPPQPAFARARRDYGL